MRSNYSVGDVVLTTSTTQSVCPHSGVLGVKIFKPPLGRANFDHNSHTDPMWKFAVDQCNVLKLFFDIFSSRKVARAVRYFHFGCDVCRDNYRFLARFLSHDGFK